jgi:tetratricopeptide (TPR) repeat protein
MAIRMSLLWWCMSLARLPLYSQFLPDLQAKTPAEYDAYLDVLDGPPIERGTAFLRSYPESALRLPVCELLARAWRERGDAARAIGSASAGLAIAPDYVPLLVELADLVANGSSGLERAEESALRALALLETVKAPQRVTATAWIEAVANLRARSYSALGLVRFKRGDADGAVQAFQAALAHKSPETPAIHYRLGRLRAAQGRHSEARRHLEQAARNGSAALAKLAAAALGELPP